jgi:sec-independent protein translocase protein TatB
MFDVGFWELVILFGLGLMVLGPERMPKVAAQLGRWAGQARTMARNLTSQIRDEIEPIQSSVDSMSKSFEETVGENVETDWSARRPEPGQPADETDKQSSASNVSDSKAADSDTSKSKTPDSNTPDSNTKGPDSDS